MRNKDFEECLKMPSSARVGHVGVHRHSFSVSKSPSFFFFLVSKCWRNSHRCSQRRNLIHTTWSCKSSFFHQGRFSSDSQQSFPSKKQKFRKRHAMKQNNKTKHKTKQNKTKQNKTKQNKTKQNKTKQTSLFFSNWPKIPCWQRRWIISCWAEVSWMEWIPGVKIDMRGRRNIHHQSPTTKKRAKYLDHQV